MEVYGQQQETLRPVSTVPEQSPDPGNPLRILAQGAGQAANTSGQLFDQQADLRNADRVLQAQSALMDNYRQFESKVQQRTGQNAWGVTNDVADWWQQNASKALDGMENPVQRKMLGDTVTRLRTNSLDSASQFEGQQRKISLDTSAQAATSSSINLAASQYNNPNAVAQARSDVLAHVATRAQLNGWSPEVTQFNREETLTKFHAGIIQAMVDSDPQGATNYFVAHKDEIAGTDQDSLEKLLHTGTIKRQSQSMSQQILSGGGTEAQMLALARSKTAGDLQDEIVTRIKARFEEQHQQLELGQKNAADSAWKLHVGDPQNGIAPVMLSDMPARLKNALSGTTIEAIANAEQTKADKPTKTDWDTYNDLTDMMALHPQEFAQLDMRNLTGKLADTDMRALIKSQEDMKSPGGLDDQVATSQQIASTVQIAKLTNKQDIGMLNRYVQREIASEQAIQKRKLTSEERQKIIDRGIIQGSAPGHFFDQPFASVAGTADAAHFVASIPSDEKRRIKQLLKAKGQDASNDQIADYYRSFYGLPTPAEE